IDRPSRIESSSPQPRCPGRNQGTSICRGRASHGLQFVDMNPAAKSSRAVVCSCCENHRAIMRKMARLDSEDLSVLAARHISMVLDGAWSGLLADLHHSLVTCYDRSWLVAFFLEEL